VWSLWRFVLALLAAPSVSAADVVPDQFRVTAEYGEGSASFLMRRFFPRGAGRSSAEEGCLFLGELESQQLGPRGFAIGSGCVADEFKLDASLGDRSGQLRIRAREGSHVWERGSTAGPTRISLTAIRGPNLVRFREGTPQETKYVGVAVISDAARVADLGGSEAALAAAEQTIVAANKLLEEARLTPRVRLVLTQNLAFDDDPYVVGADGLTSTTELLGLFNDWASASTDLIAHDVHVMLTGLDLANSDVGATALGAACLPGFNGLIVEGRAGTGPLTAETLVHEIGHLLGMGHDGTDNVCAGGIMSPTTTGFEEAKFSSCSQDEFQRFLANAFDSRCLADVPVVAGAASCGDGVRSGDEECDCGTTTSCKSIDKCCDPVTCKLASGAKCSGFNDGASCCTAECAIEDAGVVCRPEATACDIPEVCIGASASCPGDVWNALGRQCLSSDGTTGACFQGLCVSRQAQCEEAGDLARVDLTSPPESCLAPDAPCGEAVCFDESANICRQIGLIPQNGIPCASDALCIDSVCTPIASIDECPETAKKTPGECGCAIPDDDEDADGIVRCLDGCPRDAFKIAPGRCGCGVPEAANCVDDSKKAEPGCSCRYGGQDSSRSKWAHVFVLLGLVGARRWTRSGKRLHIS